MRTLHGLYGVGLFSLFAAMAPNAATALDLHVGGNGTPVVSVGNGGGSTAGATANVGNSTANANLGGPGDSTANANVNLGDTLGATPGNDSTANADIGLGNTGASNGGGTDADVMADLGSLGGGGADQPTTANAQIGLGNGNSLPGASDGDISVDLGALSGTPGDTGSGAGTTGNDTIASSGSGDGATSAGGLGGSELGSSITSNSGMPLQARAGIGANCYTPGGKQVLDTAAHTHYGATTLDAWTNVPNVKIVPVKFCPNLRAAVDQATSRNANIGEMRTAMASDPEISASLARAHVNADHILLAHGTGKTLSLYVY